MPADLDIDNIDDTSAAHRALLSVSNERLPGFCVVIQRAALQAVHAHGKSDTSVEICGVLVGNLHKDRISPYLLIQACIPGSKAASKQTQVTFTAETWNDIQKVMERDHPTKKIVGWYHTHPGFGVFLSGMDLFIQDNFFNLPWQIAWVNDPVANTDGVFVWKLGKSEPATFLIEEDVNTPPVEPTPNPAITSKHRNHAMMAVVIAFMAFFLLAWFSLSYITQNGARVRWPIEW